MLCMLLNFQGGITLPPGLQLPPGAMLMKNAEGQLMVVPPQRVISYVIATV